MLNKFRLLLSFLLLIGLIGTALADTTRPETRDLYRDMYRDLGRSFEDPLVETEYDFMTSQAIPSWLTYTRNDNPDNVATTRNASGDWVTVNDNVVRHDHAADGTALGVLIETSKQNKNTNTNVNPTATTNVTKGGDALSALTVVDQTAAVATAHLDALCTNGDVFFLDNSLGVTDATATIGGTTGNTNPHSLSVFAWGAGSGSQGTFGLTAHATQTTITGTTPARYLQENVTPGGSSDQFVITAAAGKGIYFIVNQLEESKFATSPIKTAGAAATRAKDLLQGTTLSAIPGYRASQGAVVVDVDLNEIINHGNMHFFALSEGTGLTNHMSVYGISGRSQDQTRTYVDSVSQYSSDIGSIDKSGEGYLYHYPTGVTWRNGSIVTTVTGPGVFTDITPSSTIDGIDRLILGSRTFSEEINGHIRSVKIFNKHIDTEDLIPEMVQENENCIFYTGQSNSTTPFHMQTSGDNDGERAGIAIFDSFFPSTRNWLVKGGTVGTSIRDLGGADSSYWVNEDTGVFGEPMRRAVTIATGISENCTVKAIVDISGESDAGNGTYDDYDAAQVLKFTTLRNLFGNVPVILQPLGRNTSSDFSSYQSHREYQRTFASKYDWVYEAPDRFDLPLTDFIHLDDDGSTVMTQRDIRKTMAVIGETVTGAVDPIKIAGISRSADEVTVNLTLPSGITDFTPSTGIEGFVFLDNATPITITSADRVDADTILLTLNSTPSNASQTLYYARNSLQTVDPDNLVKGNDTYTIPLRAEKWASSDTGSTWGSVINEAPQNTVAPTISGNAYVGQTLTAGNGTWGIGYPTPFTYTYQWKRDGTAIPGATSSTYDLTTSDILKTITVDVTASNAYGSNTATSSNSKVLNNFLYSVQEVSITIGTSSTSNTATISAVGADAFVVWNGETATGSTTSDFAVSQAGLTLTNSTTVTATRSTSSASNTVTVKGIVIDPTPNLVESVQKGTIAVNNATSNTGAISAVDTTRTAVFMGGVRSTSGSTPSRTFGGMTLTNSTTITANLGNTASTTTATFHYVAVQFRAAVISSLQQFATSSSAASSYTQALSPSVDTARTMIAWAGNTSVSGNLNSVLMNTVLTNGTTLTYTKTQSSGVATVNYVTAIEFVAGVLASDVQRGTLSVASATSNTATISSVDETMTWLNLLGLRCSATTPDEGLASIEQTDATTLTGAKNTAGTTTSILSFEALEFN